ncbi:NUDIX domain-containing protein [Brevibacillus borstelensis]|uniref:NUDIX domain-containing protein n=1 Tax=Brevibacillus borstelensis TaxID=45462 RepID=UPI0030BAF08E
MKIKNSVKAIIIDQGKLLVSKYEDEVEGTYYLLPGGGQEPGETLHQTLIRECLEETGFSVTPDELLFIRECFMQSNIHRVEFMFACNLNPDQPLDCSLSVYDDKQVGIDWLPIGNLLQQPLYPVELRELILEKVGSKQTPIYVGQIS